MSEWLPSINLDWDKVLHWVPEAFFSTVIGLVGVVLVRWLLAVKQVPNWIPILFLPPIIGAFTFWAYMTQTDGSRIPQWAVDPSVVRKIIALAVAAASVIPALMAVASHAKKCKTGNTSFWTRDEAGKLNAK